MKWFTGSIPEAVAQSKINKSLFCVAILGEDDDSKSLLSTLEESPETQSLIETHDVIFIRIQNQSQEHAQLKSIYNDAVDSSILCISLNGKVIGQIANPADLKGSFETILKSHLDSLLPSEEQGPHSSNSSSGEQSSSKNEQSPTNNEKSLEERIERARKIAAAKQEAKREEEAAEARRLETERREAGRKVAELKRWQDEVEAKRLVEERKKDKREEAELRQRLREQIAQDRIDREARMNKNKNIENNTTSRESSGTNSVLTPNLNRDFSGKARLQFRLPDGSTHIQAFEPHVNLAQVRQYIIQNSLLNTEKFSIWVAFPRREFSGADYESTLGELGLLPSASLLLIPIVEKPLLPQLGGSGLINLLSSIFLTILTPLTLIWTYFMGGNSNSSTPSTSASNNANNSPNDSASAREKRNLRVRGDGNEPSTSTPSQNNDERFGRQDGNIRRLRRGESESDEDLGTYNGNSTQQM